MTRCTGSSCIIWCCTSMMASSPGTSKLFQGLRFPISSGRLAEFGELPLTNISACVSTIRPPDIVIIESTEISGQNAFEEIVNLEDLQNLEDPLKNQLIELARTHGRGTRDVGGKLTSPAGTALRPKANGAGLESTSTPPAPNPGNQHSRTPG